MAKKRARRSKKLNRYVVELWHEPNLSPLTNKAYREKSNKTHAALPSLLQERGMIKVGAYHLDPEHRAFLVFDAKSVEDVRDVLYQSGFMAWCNGRIYPSTPLPEMHEWSVAQEPVE